MRMFRIPGPQRQVRIDRGTLCRAVSPVPGPVGFKSAVTAHSQPVSTTAGFGWSAWTSPIQAASDFAAALLREHAAHRRSIGLNSGSMLIETRTESASHMVKCLTMPSNQKATHCWTANGVPSQFDLQMEQRNAGEWIIQATL